MTSNEHNIGDDAITFLNEAGWGDASVHALAGDASSRSYKRLTYNERKAVLMIAPPDAESAPCAPEASDQERRALGYNACARLAGPNLNAFTHIATALRAVGLSAPEIYAANAETGLALIEDLGDDLYARVIGNADEQALYAHAIDALVSLVANPPQRPVSSEYTMLEYDYLALKAEASLFTEWYWPLKTGAVPSADICNEYDDIIDGILRQLSAPHAIVLRDFHAENLIWLPERTGPARVGLIDFQDGLYGHSAYDLVSLLEDARRDVSPALADMMIARYIEKAAAASANFKNDSFLHDYAILAAQRNAKILGVFARLAKRDQKPRYLDLLPRVEAHFRRDLARDSMAPLRKFLAVHLPDLTP